MATKVVKSFKKKVINTVKCSRAENSNKTEFSTLDLIINKLLVT